MVDGNADDVFLDINDDTEILDQTDTFVDKAFVDNIAPTPVDCEHTLEKIANSGEDKSNEHATNSGEDTNHDKALHTPFGDSIDDTGEDMRHKDMHGTRLGSDDEVFEEIATNTRLPKRGEPVPALHNTPTATRQSSRNRVPRNRMNLNTVRSAMQAAVIAASATLFPPTTQLFDFPLVFGNPMDTGGMAQQCQAKRIRLNRPNLHMETMGKQELDQLRYVQQMDSLYEDAQNNPEDMQWKVESITSHCIRKRKGS